MLQNSSIAASQIGAAIGLNIVNILACGMGSYDKPSCITTASLVWLVRVAPNIPN